jgi:hypothetical protein
LQAKEAAMTLTVTWGTGETARSWTANLPGTVPILTAVSLPNRAAVKRALGLAEPFLVLGAEATGAGIPELLLVAAAVAAAKHVLSEHRCTGPEPADSPAPSIRGHQR